MGLKFNIDRPKVTDDEIDKRKDFEQLVRRFREQSLKKARGDESWHRKKLIRYTAAIAGVTVICTITYQSIQNSNKKQVTKHETINTPASSSKAVSGNTLHLASQKSRISPPSKKLATAYTSYTVNAQRGGTITHKRGSNVKVPSGSFVDKQGRDVIGNVTIEYREFHDLGDVIMNGIPMSYDSAGHAFNLETAGMFDIRGHQDGEPVFIKPDKPLEVKLASLNKEDRFNQYYFDTVDGNWRYIRRDNPLTASETTRKPKSEKAVSEKQIAIQKEEFSKRLTKKTDSLAAVYKQQIARLPAPRKPSMPAKATPGRPSFVLEGSYEEFPELSVFDNVVFEIGPENKNYSRELHDVTWSDIRISPGPQKDRNYILNLSYRNRREQLVVYPVLAEKDYDVAMKKHAQKLEEYNRVAEKRAAAEQRIVAEMEAKQKAFMDEERRKQQELERTVDRGTQAELSADFSAMNSEQKAARLFNVAKFGIYNSDFPHTRPTGEAVRPVFMLHGKAKFIRPDRVYVIDHKKKTVNQYSGNEEIVFSEDAATLYSMCAFSGKKLYICNKESLLLSREKESNHFEVKQLSDNEENPADFKKALEL
jgi:hypothetical protein